MVPMSLFRLLAALLISVTAVAALPAQRGGGTRIAPGQECPPGTSEVRPGNCQAPSGPAARIHDYRPKSTLVTAEHKVPKAKIPTIDVHGHPGDVSTPAAIERVVAVMDSLNLKVMLVAENVSG